MLLKRFFGKLRVPMDSRLIEFIGKRSTLQLMLLVVCIAVMVPHSRIHSRDFGSIEGREIPLYSLVGPGQQDFPAEEVLVGAAAPQQADERAWSSGAALVTTPRADGREMAMGDREIAGLSPGGTAITKPTILTGSDLPVAPDPNDEEQIQQTGRREVIEYTVQPGDVIGTIAQKFGVDSLTVMWANSLTSRSTIRPGQTLTILPTSGVLHTVKSGDTISKIALAYDAEVDDVVSFNRLQKDGSDIRIGEQLVVPGGVIERTVSRPAQPTVTRPSRPQYVPPPAPSTGAKYIWPTSVRRITQYYGWRHTGVDIAGPIGSPLYASRAGSVRVSQCGWNGGYGCYIIINHGDGFETLYAHASQLNVKPGDYVVQGQVIALMGSTGRSTGPHIHFEVRAGGSRQNPLAYVQ